MYITRTYLDKFNTIIKDSEINTGLNPIGELVYGKNVTRILIHFDHSKIKKLLDDKVCPDINKFKHILKITNCGSINHQAIRDRYMSSISIDEKVRATSFDVIFFKIPKDWDNGKGFDYNKNSFNVGRFSKFKNGSLFDSDKLVSKEGSNWYQAKKFDEWNEEGIYSNLTLSNEYDKFSSELGSNIIIGRQHFDIGDENIELDITELVNSYILCEEENHGIGIAFSPQFERTEKDCDNYLGLFGCATNTFFEPFVETKYDDVISDDRNNFIIGKKNRLYLYVNIGGDFVNLDEIPTCEINGNAYEVHQSTTGIYYIDITINKGQLKPYTMLYDIWSNISYNGEKLDDVELYFTVIPNDKYINIGAIDTKKERMVLNAYGIKDNEEFKRGDIRKITFLSKKPYTSENQSTLSNNIYWRLYVKDGEREIDVIPFNKVNKSFLENYAIIDTNMLIPNKYYIDAKIQDNTETIHYRELLRFKIIEDLTQKYFWF